MTKQKILALVEVEVVDDGRRCSMTCPFLVDTKYVDSECANYYRCRLFGGEMKGGQGEVGCARSPRCIAAAGNHNILSKCLAGE